MAFMVLLNHIRPNVIKIGKVIFNFENVMVSFDKYQTTIQTT